MTPKRITIHCTATPNGKPVSINAIRKDHIENRKWSDIGYHYLIGVLGDIDKGRADDVQGAGVEGANADNLHVCMVGTDKFTELQFEALFNLVQSLCMKYAIAEWQIYTHNEFESAWKQMKACPGIKPSHLLNYLWTGNHEAVKAHYHETQTGPG